MRSLLACALVLGGSLFITPSAATAANVPHFGNRPSGDLVTVQGRRYYRPQRDCTPYNGPFGFYGNLWCQPTNDASYLRNLGSGWPIAEPPGLRNKRPTLGPNW
jgi:hypothetical protein